MYDSATSDLLSHAPTVVSFISTALHHGSVLVHCQRGISRSTTAVLFYLMGGAGLTLQEGMDLCKRRRPEVDPIPAFVEQLKIYESRCKKMDMVRSSENSFGGVGSGDLKGKSKKRKAGEVSIGPARGPPRGPTRPVHGPPRGPIGPTKKSMKDGDNGGHNDHNNDNSHKKTQPLIGPSPMSPPCEDEDNNIPCLLEQHKTRAKS